MFNFGKYKGREVKEVLSKDPGFYFWMANADFPLNTKQVLTRLRMQYMQKK